LLMGNISTNKILDNFGLESERTWLKI